MKRFHSIPGLIFLIVILSVSATYLVDNVIELPKINLETFTNVVSILSSIILLGIAVALHNRFSGSQSLIDKQTEKVVELMTLLSGARFIFEVVKNNKSIGWHFIKLTEYKKRRPDLVSKSGKDYRTFVNYADHSLWDLILEVNQLADDPYLPKSLAARLQDKTYIASAKHLKNSEKSANYLLLKAQGDFTRTESITIGVDDGSVDNEKFTELYNTQFNADDMMYRLETVYSSAYNWLTNHNKSIANTLNLEKVEKFVNGKDIY